MPTDLYISEDLLLATSQKTEPQIAKLKAAKQAGTNCIFSFRSLSRKPAS